MAFPPKKTEKPQKKPGQKQRVVALGKQQETVRGAFLSLQHFSTETHISEGSCSSRAASLSEVKR